MTLVAGVDIGNTTTEVVVVEARSGEVRPLAWDRAPTRSTKGSEASLHGAAVLVRRLEKRLGRSVELVAAAPLRPVHTRATSLAAPAPPTGRLRIVRAAGSTVGGGGTAVGVPLRIDGPVLVGRGVVLLVPAGTGYAVTAAAVSEWVRAGADVRGLLLADDEGVLVSARLPPAHAVPVVDEVDIDDLADAALVAVEIRPPGHQLQDLGDPIRLSWLLGLDGGERDDAAAVAHALGAGARGVVALDPVGAALAVAAAPSVEPSAGSDGIDGIDDLWLVELGAVARSVGSRVDPAIERTTVRAALSAREAAVDPAPALAAQLGRPVHVAGSEAVAARAGAASTPGVRPSITVVDLGGGTVDAVSAGGVEVVVAGAGELLTVAVAAFLALPRGAADWVKRGPCSRLEAPQVLLAEDGTRSFLDRPAPSAAVGSLVVPGPAGLLPFGGRLAPAEWRALRLRTKQAVLVDNVARALGALPDAPAGLGDVLLVGGAAGDEELVALFRTAQPGVMVGRGDVAGVLGHRYAVAYGLALLATA